MWHLRVSLIRLKVKYDCHVLQEGGELYFSDMYASKPVPDRSTMSLSSSGPPPRIEDWTREDVRHWLISEVKVNQTCADKFFNEDVSGDFLVEFTKKEILDLDIKHGPAVKITHYLKQLKKEPTHNPQYPAYVQTWTKEQVNQWLLQHVKLYGKFTQQLLDEEVSGECLICFEKQDFKDRSLSSHRQ